MMLFFNVFVISLYNLYTAWPYWQLKQKTVELTRACQKQYELEQELAFQKIDAKFEPYPYYPDHVSASIQTHLSIQLLP